MLLLFAENFLCAVALYIYLPSAGIVLHIIFYKAVFTCLAVKVLSRAEKLLTLTLIIVNLRFIKKTNENVCNVSFHYK